MIKKCFARLFFVVFRKEGIFRDKTESLARENRWQKWDIVRQSTLENILCYNFA